MQYETVLWLRLSYKIFGTSSTTSFVRGRARTLCHSVTQDYHYMSAAPSSSAAHGSKRAAIDPSSPHTSMENSAKRQRISSEEEEKDATPPFSLRDAMYWAQPQRLAAFQKPAPLCSFSYDAQRALHHDDRQRKYYRPPFDASSKGPLDLNHRYEHFVERANSGVSCACFPTAFFPFCELRNFSLRASLRALPHEQPEHLDSLLASLRRAAQQSPDFDAELRRANVITWRGIMTKLCTALYEERDGFTLNAQIVRANVHC